MESDVIEDELSNFMQLSLPWTLDEWYKEADKNRVELTERTDYFLIYRSPPFRNLFVGYENTEITFYELFLANEMDDEFRDSNEYSRIKVRFIELFLLSVSLLSSILADRPSIGIPVTEDDEYWDVFGYAEWVTTRGTITIIGQNDSLDGSFSISLKVVNSHEELRHYST